MVSTVSTKAPNDIVVAITFRFGRRRSHHSTPCRRPEPRCAIHFRIAPNRSQRDRRMHSIREIANKQTSAQSAAHTPCPWVAPQGHRRLTSRDFPGGYLAAHHFKDSSSSPANQAESCTKLQDSGFVVTRRDTATKTELSWSHHCAQVKRNLAYRLFAPKKQQPLFGSCTSAGTFSVRNTPFRRQPSPANRFLVRSRSATTRARDICFESPIRVIPVALELGCPHRFLGVPFVVYHDTIVMQRSRRNGG